MKELFSNALLEWYDAHKRILPWRCSEPNPYHVYLSEIMLQQTTVSTVVPYFLDFIHKWPTLKDLASASLDEVLHAWQGLGYYSRARNLHKAAQHMKEEVPSNKESLLNLPGIGPYTAAAILSIAFNKPEPVMDGNIERIMARLFRVQTPLLQAKKELYEKASFLTPQRRPGCHAQALMDLGAGICTPQSPYCHLCPLTSFCLAYKKGDMTLYPKKLAKKPLPQLYGIIYWMLNDKGEVLIQKRPPSGLLGGMMGFPGTAWGAEKPQAQGVSLGVVRHTFTHFKLHLEVVLGGNYREEGLWCPLHDLNSHAFPTLMKKVIKVAASFNTPT